MRSILSLFFVSLFNTPNAFYYCILLRSCNLNFFTFVWQTLLENEVNLLLFLFNHFWSKLFIAKWIQYLEIGKLSMTWNQFLFRRDFVFLFCSFLRSHLIFVYLIRTFRCVFVSCLAFKLKAWSFRMCGLTIQAIPNKYHNYKFGNDYLESKLSIYVYNYLSFVGTKKKKEISSQWIFFSIFSLFFWKRNAILRLL